MKNFRMTFYFEDEKQEIIVSAEQLGLNFGLNKIFADLSDGTNTFSERDKALAEFQKENKPRQGEYEKLILQNDITWEHEGKKYRIEIPACEDWSLEIFEDGVFVDTAPFYLTLID